MLTREQTIKKAMWISAGSITVSLAVMVVGIDQLSKRLASNALSANPDGGPSVGGDWIRLTYTTNTGAAFGVLADRSILFLLIACVVFGVVIAYWRFLPLRHPALRVSLGLQLGGACGNLLDRIRDGHVIDFIEIRYWPVFNLADTAIVAGVLMLMYYLVLSPPAMPSATAARDGRDPD